MAASWGGGVADDGPARIWFSLLTGALERGSLDEMRPARAAGQEMIFR